jgi:hypothetical protein
MYCFSGKRIDTSIASAICSLAMYNFNYNKHEYLLDLIVSVFNHSLQAREAVINSLLTNLVANIAQTPQLIKIKSRLQAKLIPQSYSMSNHLKLT